MIKKILFLLILPVQLSLTSVTPAKEAATNSQLNSIAALGKLNGIALQCNYIEQMQRIKQALVLNLPKKRALGDWFESSTNTAFLNFMNNNNNCGSIAIFTLKVDDAIVELENAFKN